MLLKKFKKNIWQELMLLQDVQMVRIRIIMCNIHMKKDL